MLEDNQTDGPTTSEAPADAAAEPTAKKTAKKAPAKKAPAKKAAAKRPPAKKTPARKPSAKQPADQPAEAAETAADQPAEAPAATAPAKKAARKTTSKATGRKAAASPAEEQTESAPAVPGTMLLFQAPDASQAPARKPRKKAAAPDDTPAEGGTATAAEPAEPTGTRPEDGPSSGEGGEGGEESGEGGRRRRRRGGRRRRKSSGGDAEAGAARDAEQSAQPAQPDAAEADSSAGKAAAKKGADEKSSGQKGSGRKASGQKSDGGAKGGQGGADATDDATAAPEKEGESSSSRRRRRRRRAGDDAPGADDDPQNTVTKVRQGRSPEDQITALTGSTRLEAKKQRRREGREAGRRRAPIVSEAEFLARRESVDRVMAIRQRDDLTQIAVLEDKVLVEHYVARESQTSLIGNVYLGRVQNVLPSMEAAFIDIGKGRNAVLYAGEVNWSALGHQEGQPRKIESVLSSGQTVLVQVTKDPVGHKGARLTSQVSLAGRFLVYVPDGTNSGISRKLPDTERNRLKKLLKEVVPEGAGVIVRTAAEGASEEELTRDVERLTARWADIEKKAKGSAPQLLYGEPDLMLKVVRDLFTEDFSRLVVQGDDAWDTVQGYVAHVAPDLEQRLERYDDSRADLFSTYRIDEQIHKGLDRKVWLPSGGSLIIDRTEAMTVVDVNTGKFTGSGGNLEETVTKNNLEAAEEIVRQLRLRDIGGIIVVDFIDMVLESNRDLVLRRLVECLGRDRTRHQVAEVTSLGLVQMTRKRIGTGLLEAFSETCDHCGGRGVIVAEAPVEPKKAEDDSRRGSRRSRGKGRGGDSSGDRSSGNGQSAPQPSPSPKDVAAMARPPKAEDEKPTDEQPAVDEAPAEEKAPVEAPAEEQPAAEVQTAEPQPAVDVTPAGERTAADQADVPTPEGEQPQPEPAAAPAAPKVVTRTRRRAASRPAGPPAGGPVDADRSAPEAEPSSSDTAAETPETEAAPAVGHVPVKKRGSRKR